MIPIRVHAVIDWVVAGALIAAPFLFGFADGGTAQVVTLGLSLVIAYSLLTDYELGALRALPFQDPSAARCAARRGCQRPEQGRADVILDPLMSPSRRFIRDGTTGDKDGSPSSPIPESGSAGKDIS